MFGFLNMQGISYWPVASQVVSPVQFVGCYVLFGKPEVYKFFRRPRRRWEDNIKMDLESNVTELLIRLIWLMTSGVPCGEPLGFIKYG